MKKSKFYLLSGFLGLVITTLVVSSIASAHGLYGQSTGARNIDPERLATMEEHHQAMEQYHDAIQTAIENGDYNTWKEATDSIPRITDFINQDNFDQFVQMHKYMQEGDFEAAQTLKDELGLPELGMGMGMHKGFGMRHGFANNNLEK
ncbi:MAG: hypothetical protein WCS88_01140 [Patescibacteria group bacterium]|jgi:hypothetical protein